ncbi:MAG: nucleotidyltransferase domain-containing protein [Acidobacteria bacterium]|nr:nucleotidyltransferase domain-containing protein [Acidobacteriota bacterium]
MADAALIGRLREVAGPLFRDRSILAAYAYGSRVAGRPRPESDLDVGYYLAPPRLGESLPIVVELRLASALSESMGVEIDLRSLVDAPLELRGCVLEEGIRIYSGDDVARVGLERDLLARYHDYKDVFRQMHEIRLKRAARRS